MPWQRYAGTVSRPLAIARYGEEVDLFEWNKGPVAADRFLGPLANAWDKPPPGSHH